MCRSSEIQLLNRKQNQIQFNRLNNPVTGFTSPPPECSPAMVCGSIRPETVSVDPWKEEGTKSLESETKNDEKQCLIDVLCCFFVVFSWFPCDSYWSVVVLIAGLLLELPSDFRIREWATPPSSILFRIMRATFMKTSSTCSFDKFLSWTQHNSCFIFFGEKPRGDVGIFFNLGNLRMDLFKVISAETNPTGAIAVSIAHDLLVFRGTSCIGIDF